MTLLAVLRSTRGGTRLYVQSRLDLYSNKRNSKEERHQAEQQSDTVRDTKSKDLG